jgi:segregation and condensation protein B
VSPEVLKNVLEAALLAAGRPLTVEGLCELLGNPDPPSAAPEHGAPPAPTEGGYPPTAQEVRAALARLGEEYAGRGIEVREVASGFRIQVRPEYGQRLVRLWAERPVRYSRALLETLALVAYRQPISRGEIEEVRGVSVSTSILKTLQDRDWVRVVGHRDAPGRPALYGTTRQFLDDFNLRRLSDLPPLPEVQNLDRVTVDLFASLPLGVEVGPAAAGEDAETGEPPPAAGAAADTHDAPPTAALPGS